MLKSILRGIFMKKIFAALILASMVTFSFTACSSSGGNNNSSETSRVRSSVSSKSSESSMEESIEESISSKPASNKTYASLDDFINSDYAKKIIDSTQETAGDVMTFELIAEGNKLVYKYKYTSNVNIDGSNFDNYLDSYTSTYTASAKEIERIVDVDDPHIILRYNNDDDTLIYEIEFDSDGVVNKISNSPEPEDSDESSTESKSTIDNGEYNTAEEFVKSDLISQTVETTRESAGDAMEFDIVSEGDNKVVYLYKYTEQVDVDPDYFTEALDSYEDVYVSVAKTVKSLVSFDNPIVVLKYVNADDSLIYAVEFDESGIVNEMKGE